MTRALQLESFRRAPAPPPPPEPMFDAGDLALARARGFAEGRAAARDEAGAALHEAVAGLAAALSQDEARRAAMALASRQELGKVAGAIVATLAGPLRAEALAGRVVAALLAEMEAGAPAPSRIRCEAGAAVRLGAALAANGLAGIAVESGGSGAEFALSDGTVRLDPERLQAALHDIIAEIGAPDAGSHP